MELHPPGEDASLARALKQRNPRAMAQLYDRYGALVYSRVYSMVRNQALAEDLVQEIFFRVWRRASRFDEARGSLSTWVQAVARNHVIDYLRFKGSRLDRQTDSIDLQPMVDSRLTCEDEAIRFDLFGRLSAAVGRLNLNQRTVLQLAFQEGLSHPEVARRLQQPLGTVKTRIRRALQCLRAAMLECGGA